MFSPTDLKDQTTLIQIRQWTFLSLVLLSVLAVGITVLALSFGYTIVFQNLYYLPIIMACINYPKRGMLFTTCISAVYVALMFAIPKDPSLIVPVLVRLAFFELVAAVLVYLCKEKNEAEKALLGERFALTEKIMAQEAYIHTELEKARRLANACRETSEHEQLLFNQLDFPLLVLNPDRYIIRVNQAFTKLTGRQEADLVGRKLSTIEPLDEAAGKPYGIPVEVALADKDGAIHRVLWSFSAIRTPGETLPSAIVAMGQALPGTDKGRIVDE